jgi:hypothetical protein
MAKMLEKNIFCVEATTFYCIEGTEMRQLSFKVRRLLFLNRY